MTVPARINILGNPSDANEGDFATISAAVNVFAGALVEPADKFVIEMGPKNEIVTDFAHPDGSCRPDPSFAVREKIEISGSKRQVFEHSDIPLSYDGELDLIKAAVNRLYHHSDEFKHKIKKRGIRIAVWSRVPRQSGLGGSSLIVLLTLAGLRQAYELDRIIHNDYVLAEITQNVEAKELAITCGFADRYAPLFGGLAYIDYRGKLFQKELGDEPYATYERLDGRSPQLPLVAITTGIKHQSGDVHGRMRPRYLQEYLEWRNRGGPPPPMVRYMQGAWKTAWQGKIALLAGDLEGFGQLMNVNHHWVDEMMTYCGFEDGAGWANNTCIQAAIENGALGAKLTGAGGGGSVFALTKPGCEDELVRIWQKTAQQAGLTQAHIFQPKICKHGLWTASIRER
jgi:galactokinase/mevalonate kinase-like predicted kinase